MIDLYPHQADLIQRTRAAFQAGHRRVLTQLPTGGGKGTMLAHQVGRLDSQSARVLALAHRKELVADLAGRIGLADVEHGIIAPWAPHQPELSVQVGSVDTIGRRLEQILTPDWLIVDEAHHLVVGNKWGRVVEAWPDAWLWGLTATPERLDGRGLGEGHGGYFQWLECGPQVSWLVENDFLARPRCWSIPSADLDSVARPDSLAGQQQQAEILGTRQVLGDVLEHYQLHVANHYNGTCIGYAASVERAEAYCAAFREAGIAAAVVHGKTPDNERDQMFRDLADASLKYLWNCELVTEGVDVPGVAAVQLVRRTQSLSLYLQMAGRALRTAPGKRHAVILDHAGTMRQPGFGSPLRDRTWSLAGRRVRPRETMPAGRECPKCWAFLPGRPDQCSECGHNFVAHMREIVEIDGELVEIDPRYERLRREQAERAAKRQREWDVIRRHPDSLAGLQAAAAELGYKSGWAWHRWQARQRQRSNLFDLLPGA